MATRRETRTVELFQAFLWTCDDCSRDNYERAITISPESIDLGSLPENGIDAETIRDWIEAGGSGDWMMAPKHVKCAYCEAEFDVAMEEDRA